MKAIVKFTCVEGSALVYADRGSEGTPLAAGNSAELPVADFPDVNPKDVKGSFKTAIVHALAAPGIGGNQGKVSATATNAPLLVTQYLDKNHFLNPDAEDKRRHRLDVGESVTVQMTPSNRLTLIVEDVL